MHSNITRRNSHLINRDHKVKIDLLRYHRVELVRGVRPYEVAHPRRQRRQLARRPPVDEVQIFIYLLASRRIEVQRLQVRPNKPNQPRELVRLSKSEVRND